MAVDRAADELLVCHRSVELSGVQEVDPQLPGAVNCRDRLLLVGGAVKGRHPHASQAKGGYLEWTELACLHLFSWLRFSSPPDRFRVVPGVSTGKSVLAHAMGMQMVLGHLLELDAVDLPGGIERHLMEEDDLLRCLVANPLTAEHDQVRA